MNWRGRGALPVRRVTGKLLFPRAEIEEWIVTNGGGGKPGRGKRGPTSKPAARHRRRT